MNARTVSFSIFHAAENIPTSAGRTFPSFASTIGLTSWFPATRLPSPPTARQAALRRGCSLRTASQWRCSLCRKNRVDAFQIKDALAPVGSSVIKFVAIGHIVNDTAPLDHLGGGVSYSAIAAQRLGHEAHIITKCRPDHPYIRDLEGMGVRTHPLPTNLDTITSFENIYDENGKRAQYVSEVQEPITCADLRFFPRNLLQEATVLVAPVIHEVDMELYPALSQSKMLAVAPQGYFRAANPGGKVSQKPWTGFEGFLRHAHATIFSEEDSALGSDSAQDQLLRAIVNECKLVALTRGAKGASILCNGSAFEFGVLSLQPDETRDLTGAGDTFAATLVTELARGTELRAAAVSAAFFAALKIRAGSGIDAIPTLEQVTEFAKANPQRIQCFVEQESVPGISLFDLC
jgi:sugar/nucleoside kinase (ribokinase family)